MMPDPTESLRLLGRCTLPSQDPFLERVDRLLGAGCQLFGSAIGVLTRRDGAQFRVEAARGAPGTTPPPVGDTYFGAGTRCETICTAGAAMGFTERGDFETDPCYGLPNFEASLGAPVRVRGRIIGTLSFADLVPRPDPYSPFHLELLTLMSQWVGGEIERDETQEEVEQSHQRRAIAERAKTETEALSRAILDAVPDAIVTIDDDGRIESANAAIETLFGYSAIEVVGRGISGLIQIEAGGAPPVGEATTTAYPHGFLCTGNHRHGREFPCEFMVGPVSVAGRERITGIIRDITDRVRGENVLRRARAEAEAANEAKSEFLANMSHEIRTPLTAILGFAEMLQSSESSPAGQSSVGSILRNGEHLLQILNDILDLSKIEAAQVEVEKVPLSLPELLGEVHRLMQVRSDAAEIALEFEYRGQVPETVESDPVRLKQVLINLLGNAIKFTPKGEVRVTTRHSKAHGRGILRVEVTDTGIGISPEEADRIFRPFSQACSSTTRSHGGTGLGLTISRRLARLLGGDVELVRTTPGRGTTFAATFDTGLSKDGPFAGTYSLDPAPATAPSPPPRRGSL